MLTFSLNVATQGDGYAHKVWDVITSNSGYFKKFNRERYEEAMHKTFVFALGHRKDNYSDLTPYVKKLARTILKEKEKEKPYDVYTEDGEVSPVFSPLQDSIDESNLTDITEIKDIFKEMYLTDKEEFLKLKNLFTPHATEESLKLNMVKDKYLTSNLSKAYRLYGSTLFFKVLYQFLNEMTPHHHPTSGGVIKEVQLKKVNPNIVEKLSDEPCIKTLKDDKLHGIDKLTLKMDVNPDLVRWVVATTTNCNIIKVDISPLINYMYEQVFVEKGVDTKHIMWCDDKYKVITPAGIAYIGVDRLKFMSLVHNELVLNLLANNLNKMIAISEDSIYVRPTRLSGLETIRLKLYTGKIIDLPVELATRNR
jgi:hypothetical protein